MTFSCDTTTRSELNGAVSKLQWASVLSAALGTTRRIRCFRDPSSSAGNAFTTGTEFRNVGSSGAITTAAGRIRSLGRIKGTTIALAADMSTGTSILRVEGNGRWFQGSLGLSAAAQIAIGVAANAVVTYDFTTRGNFTVSNGFAVTPNFSIGGPRFLPSGTGPSAPALDSSAPATVELWDWTTPTAPALVGTIAFNNRAEDFVFEDAEIAADIGDVAIYQSTQSVLFGQHEFGMTLLASHPSNTEVGNIPLYQVIGAAAHRGTWTTYPFSDTFDPATHINYPAPFKLVMKNSAGSVIYTWQMSDGLAINSPDLAQHRTTTAPLRPHWNTGMWLPWQNTRPRKSTKSIKWYPGLTDDAKRPSRAKLQYSGIGVEPLITGGYQGNSLNGLHNIYATDKWPLPLVHHTQTPADPYGCVATEYNRSGASSEFAPWNDGYGYEPASFSNHNWYTGPGGPRFDRCVLPSTLALWASDPSGARTEGNVLWRDMADGFLLGYFNHSNHWVSDPKSLTLNTVPTGFLHTYYGGGAVSSTAIDLKADMRDGDNDTHRDASGRFFWAGWGRDPLHGYANAGWGSLLLNSPMHAIASKWDTQYLWSCIGDPTANDASNYMVRTQAWDWFHYVMAWKLASTHGMGLSRADVVARFSTRLEAIYRDTYKPAFIDNNQSLQSETLRRLGFPAYVGSTNRAGTSGGQLGFYMGHVLQLMKQTGMWSALQALGGHVKLVLDMQIRNMDKYCFERLIYTKMSNNDGGYQSWPADSPIPASWSDYSAQYEAADSADLVHNADGSIKYNERDVSDHLMLQYPLIRRDYFPEITHPLLDQAVAKVTSYMSITKAAVLAVTDPIDQRGRDYAYGYPGISPMKAPAELGPA